MISFWVSNIRLVIVQEQVKFSLKSFSTKIDFFILSLGKKKLMLKDCGIDFIRKASERLKWHLRRSQTSKIKWILWFKSAWLLGQLHGFVLVNFLNFPHAKSSWIPGNLIIFISTDYRRHRTRIYVSIIFQWNIQL